MFENLNSLTSKVLVPMCVHFCVKISTKVGIDHSYIDRFFLLCTGTDCSSSISGQSNWDQR